ncbi:hypothetical protein ABZP36_022837 [Zizania latifolia]
MNSRGNYRSTRTSLFDGIEEGGIRASSYSSHEIDGHENDRAIDGLQDRVSILKRLSGDIHEEVETHNRMLDRMGNDMDSSRGFLSGTVDKFKMAFSAELVKSTPVTGHQGTNPDPRNNAVAPPLEWRHEHDRIFIWVPLMYFAKLNT